jgi:hypothetical protein
VGVEGKFLMRNSKIAADLEKQFVVLREELYKERIK